MNLIERLADQPALGLVAAGVTLGVLVLVRSLQGTRANNGDNSLPGLDALIAEGRYRDAAMLCMRNDRLAEAQELFLRAQEPTRAAQVAQRLGNLRLAGELYERGGELRKAAACYERVGMGPKAQELLAVVGVQEATTRGNTTAPKQTPSRPSSQRGSREVAEGTGVRKPHVSAEERLRVLKSRGMSDDASRIEAQQVAQQVAEEALATGDIRKAAEVYRDVGLNDEAIHLYANVLGMPGEAAVLVAARGHHERAAELFELAGQKERAAASWSECVRKEGRIEKYIEHIERLDQRAAYKVLEEYTATRPANDETADAYYRMGNVLEQLGERVRALEVFATLQRNVGTYRDVERRIVVLENGSGIVSASRTNPRGTLGGSGDRTGAPAATVLVQNIQLGGADLRPEDVQALAREAARAASSQLNRASVPPGGFGMQDAVASVLNTALASRATGRRATGLESGPVSIELLSDTAVRAAREGPSLDALRRYIDNAPCNLSNIEVYYRMGLLSLAMGDWNEAQHYFESVESTSPGYRDAIRRSEEIKRWQRSMGKRITVSGLSENGVNSRYQLRGELGRGGMAVVYRATDTVLGRDVALKFIAEAAIEKKEFRDMFLREARSVAQLNHPNIVTIYDVGVLEGRTFIAMEFVEGKTVDDLVVEQKKLPVVEAMRITAQVLAALEYAHSRQIVHRDIKPSNMMRTSTGMVKLMDFGLAKSVTGAIKSSMIAGTPAYMPPEQFSGINVDHRADLYAVGASLFEMLTGDLPFDSPARTGPVPSARARVEQVPALIDETLIKVLDPDPAKRFQSAKEMLAPIQKVLAVFDRAMEERVARNATQERSAAVVSAPAPPTIASTSVVNTKQFDARDQAWETVPPPSMNAKDAMSAASFAATQMAGARNASPRQSAAAKFVRSPAPPARATAVLDTSQAPPSTRAALGGHTPAPTSSATAKRNNTMIHTPVEPFASKKGTLLMNAAAPTAATTSSASTNAPREGASTNPRSTRLLAPPREEARKPKSISSIPPPA
jgi:serine/threonine protein kinase/TolA-binding protein